jgi:tetratricopeptide (TPR) repeat protein
MSKFAAQMSFWLLTVFLVSGCATKSLPVVRQEAYQEYQAGNYSAAAEKFEKLVEQTPKDAELWFRLGNAYAKIQLPKKAVDAYENALSRDPKMGKARYNMGLIYLQASLKSFVDMDTYLAKDDPVAIKGKPMRDGILSLLGNLAEKNENKD